jgi:transcriptional regulator with XRE-family HTH domain|tara:strand:+ start:200 stop:484 length:285 start_codon:yes stop_codon:yes gene_type:complete
MKKIKERLKISIKDNGISQAGMARQIGISPNHLATILSSETGLSATIIIGFAKAGYDVQWLLTGESNLSRIAELADKLKDAYTLIDSLERILKS